METQTLTPPTGAVDTRSLSEAVAAVSAVALDLEVNLSSVIAATNLDRAMVSVNLTALSPAGSQALADAFDLPLTLNGRRTEFGPARWSSLDVRIVCAEPDIPLCQNPIGCDRLGTEPMEAGVFFCDRCCSGAQGSHYDDRDRS